MPKYLTAEELEKRIKEKKAEIAEKEKRVIKAKKELAELEEKLTKRRMGEIEGLIKEKSVTKTEIAAILETLRNSDIKEVRVLTPTGNEALTGKIKKREDAD